MNLYSKTNAELLCAAQVKHRIISRRSERTTPGHCVGDLGYSSRKQRSDGRTATLLIH